MPFIELPYETLLTELASIENEPFDILEKAVKSLKVIESILAILFKLIKTEGFESQQEEMNFFKFLKPKFYQHWVYWNDILLIEKNKPFVTEEIALHYQNWLKSIFSFLHGNAEFYFYYRSKSSAQDEIYFLRKNKDLYMSYSSYPKSIDDVFSTSGDELIARILANSRLEKYLTEQINQLNANKEVVSRIDFPAITWTTSKVHLVESIYALHEVGAFNNGNADLKLIATAFEKMFNVSLGNFFNTYSEIRLRKKNRTVFLDLLKERLIKKMEQDDDK